MRIPETLRPSTYLDLTQRASFRERHGNWPDHRHHAERVLPDGAEARFRGGHPVRRQEPQAGPREEGPHLRHREQAGLVDLPESVDDAPAAEDEEPEVHHEA